MIEDYFVVLVTHLRSLVGGIVAMARVIFKIGAGVGKVWVDNVLRDLT
jgi:hypothetical protein